MFDAKALLDQLARGAEQARTAAAGDGSASGGGFADILAQIQNTATDVSANGGGLFGQVLGQAIEGMRDGAARIDEATGAGAALQQATGGQSASDLAARVKQLAADNQLATGAVLGGLGGLVLSTGTGRSLATGAAKAGALALIGGLAYKAYQNHREGKPLLGDAAQAPAAPKGSGFESAAVSNDTATRMLRAMIAAAAADGRIDEEERRRILGVMDQSGLGTEARQFLEREIAAPADASEIAAGVTSPAVAAQIYTAARMAVGPGGGAEKSFLAGLARRLGIEPSLAAEIDSAALANG